MRDKVCNAAPKCTLTACDLNIFVLDGEGGKDMTM